MTAVRQNESRSAETRAAELRGDEDPRTPIDWKPPSVLDAPPPRPGYRQRWVATSILGKDIPHWVYRQFRQGWTPRKMDTVPEAWRVKVPTIQHGQFAGYVGVEGMVLCEMPEERAKAREQYFNSRTRELTKSFDHDLDEAEKVGGLRIRRERKTSVSRGVRAAPDSPDTE